MSYKMVWLNSFNLSEDVIQGLNNTVACPPKYLPYRVMPGDLEVALGEDSYEQATAILMLLFHLHCADVYVKVTHCIGGTIQDRPLKEGFPQGPLKCNMCGKMINPEDLRYDLLFEIVEALEFANKPTDQQPTPSDGKE